MGKTSHGERAHENFHQISRDPGAGDAGFRVDPVLQRLAVRAVHVGAVLCPSQFELYMQGLYMSIAILAVHVWAVHVYRNLGCICPSQYGQYM